MKTSDLRELFRSRIVFRGRILFPHFSGGNKNLTTTENSPTSVPWSPPGSLQELIHAPGTGTMRKWASISILAVNFPGMLHGFFQPGVEQQQPRLDLPGQGCRRRNQGRFGELQMRAQGAKKLQRPFLHGNSGFQPCPGASRTLGAVPAGLPHPWECSGGDS